MPDKELLFWAATRIQLCIDDINEGFGADYVVIERLIAVKNVLQNLNNKD